VNRESVPAAGAAGVSGAFDPAVGGLRPARGIHAGTGVSRPDQQRREAIETSKSTEYCGERSRGQGGRLVLVPRRRGDGRTDADGQHEGAAFAYCFYSVSFR
jgi:hypothetical protein